MRYASIFGVKPVTICTFLLVLSFILPASHATMSFVPTTNTNPMSAFQIQPNVSQWSYYGKFNYSYGAQYFSIYLKRGQTINVTLLIPIRNLNLYPHLGILTPYAGEGMHAPLGIQVPLGYSASELSSLQNPTLSYDQAIPSITYSLASASFTAAQTGTYYLVVFGGQANSTYEISSSPTGAGVSLGDIITMGAKSLGVYQWEHEPLLFVIMPMLLTFIIGNAIIFAKYWGDWARLSSFTFWTGSFAGIFVVGSADTMLTQTIVITYVTKAYMASIVSFAIIAITAAIGFYMLTIALRLYSNKGSSSLNRKKMIGLWILAMIASAGFLIGPPLAIFCGVAPDKVVSSKRKGKRTSVRMAQRRKR